jgi:pilus assembly protein CpaF
MDLPLGAVREHISSSIHLIVQQSRLASGQRAVTGIVEVTGMESGRIQTQELYRYDSGHAEFAGCCTMPVFADRWREQGRPLDPALFARGPAFARAAGAPAPCEGVAMTLGHRAA